VPADRLGERASAIVVQVGTGVGDAPELGRQELGGADEGDLVADLERRQRGVERRRRARRVRQRAPHVVTLEIAVEPHHGATLRVGLDTRLLRLRHDVESDRPRRVVIGVLAGEKAVEVHAAASERRLLENGSGEPHLGHVATRAADFGEQRATARDARRRRRVGHRHELQRRQPRELGRRLLRRVVDRDRGDVAYRELAGDAVAVGIRLRPGGKPPDELFAHHPHAEGRGGDDQVAHRRDSTLPAHRPHDEIGRDTAHRGEVERHRAVRPRGRRQGAEAHPLGDQLAAHCGSRAALRLLRRGVAHRQQLLGHLLRQHLQHAVAEQRGRAAHVERRLAVLVRVEEDARVRQAGAGAERLVVAAAARLAADRDRLAAAGRPGREAMHRGPADGAQHADAVEPVVGRVKEVRSGLE